MTNLREIVSRPAVLAEHHEALALVARRMFDNHVGCVVVRGHDELEGIFTERDLLRACAAGVDTHAATVGRWMSAELVTAHATEAPDAALQRMIDHHIRHLPVLGQEGLLGVVSMGQLSARLYGARSD